MPSPSPLLELPNKDQNRHAIQEASRIWVKPINKSIDAGKALATQPANNGAWDKDIEAAFQVIEG